MNVLVLGGSGFIGRAIVTALLDRGAVVSVLCRSISSCEKVEALGAQPVQGNINEPSLWLDTVDAQHALIHAACSFGANMATEDAGLTTALLSRMENSRSKKTFIYTGGTWCYGHSPDTAITEQTAYSPVPEFEWLARHSLRVQRSHSVRGMTIHPAIVVDDSDPIPHMLTDDYAQTGVLSIPVSEQLQWPLVGCKELAGAYCLLLEHGEQGAAYNAASVESQSVLTLSALVARRAGVLHKYRVKPLQYWLDTYGALCRGYGRSQRLNSERLIGELGWKPSLVVE